MRPAYQPTSGTPISGGRSSGRTGREGNSFQGGRGSGQRSGQDGGGQPRNTSPGPCRLCKDPTHNTHGCPQWEQAAKEAEQRQRKQSHVREGQHLRSAAATQKHYYATATMVADSQCQCSLGSEDDDSQRQVTAGTVASSTPLASDPRPLQASASLLLSPSSSSDSDSDGSDTEAEQLTAAVQALVAKILGPRKTKRLQVQAADDPTKRGTVKTEPNRKDEASSAGTAPAPHPGLASSIGPRPANFNVGHVSPVPTDDEYAAQLSVNNTLTYFAPPSGKHERCLGLMLQGSNTVHKKLKMLLDPGANINVIGEATCIRLGIPILPTSMRLTTSTSQDNPVVGMTPFIAFVYGAGLDKPLITRHRCLVTRDMGALYEVLVSNLDMDRYGAVMDAGKQQLAMRPEFSQAGVNSPVIELDLCKLGTRAPSFTSTQTALVAGGVTQPALLTGAKLGEPKATMHNSLSSARMPPVYTAQCSSAQLTPEQGQAQLGSGTALPAQGSGTAQRQTRPRASPKPRSRPKLKSRHLKALAKPNLPYLPSAGFKGKCNCSFCQSPTIIASECGKDKAADSHVAAGGNACPG